MFTGCSTLTKQALECSPLDFRRSSILAFYSLCLCLSLSPPHRVCGQVRSVNHKAWFRNERLASGIVCSCTYDRVICLTMRAFCSAVSRRDCCNTETAAVPWHLLIPDDWQRGKAEGSWGMPAVRKAVWLFAVSCCRPNASAQWWWIDA